jgi:putative transposase
MYATWRLRRSTLAVSLRLTVELAKNFLSGLGLGFQYNSGPMHIISRDSPCYYLTSVAKNRLPVFRSDEIKSVACCALAEARRSGTFAMYAYVIMPDHLHVVTDSTLSPSRTLQFINGIASRRIINYLKRNKHESSLLKLRHETRRHQYRFSLWNHHPDARLLLTESMLMQRVTYTHQNPVRARLVDLPLDYRWSSVRCWNGKMRDDEPLLMDIDRITWRRG